MGKFLVSFFLLIIGGSTLWAESSEGLARVGFLKFIDNTNNPAYTWVANTLPETINKSMVKQFEFIEQKKVRTIASLIKPNGKGYTPSQALAIATRGQAEILIYGNYKYDATTEKLAIDAYIYHRDGKKLIGTVKETSAVNNRVFKRIDVIAERIVDSIYRFALHGERQKKDKQETQVRVLVPTWKSKAGRKRALKEFKALKKHLSQKYSARFLTIFEFFNETKVKKSEQKRVMNYAKKKDDKNIVKWLSRRGVEDAFIIFVAKKSVQITPVVQGNTQSKVKYKAGAPKGTRQKAWAKAAQSGQGLKTKAEAEENSQNLRVSLKKNLQKSEVPAVSESRFTVTAIAGVLRPFGFLARSFSTSVGVNFDICYGLLPGFETGLKVGFYYFLQKQSNRDKMLLFPVQPYIGWPLRLTDSFIATPYTALGIDTGTYIGLVQTDFFLIPSFEIGNRFDYILSPSVLINLDIAFHTHYDKRFLMFARLGLGMALRF